jgi:hypothetical protein
MMRLILVLCLAMAGCSTAAQRQGEQIKSSLSAASAEWNACSGAIRDSPAYAALQAHIPNDVNKATLPQMTDSTFATDSELALLSDRRTRVIDCQAKLTARLTPVVPSIVPIITDNRNEMDQNLVALAKHQENWGDYVVRAKSINAGSTAKMQAAFHQIDAELAAANQQELAQRQAAAAAFSQSVQTQQIINNANRPVTTSCNRFGNSVNCTTY